MDSRFYAHAVLVAMISFPAGRTCAVDLSLARKGEPEPREVIPSECSGSESRVMMHMGRFESAGACRRQRGVSAAHGRRRVSASAEDDVIALSGATV